MQHGFVTATALYSRDKSVILSARCIETLIN
jgi:hypothetical protein